MGNKDYDLGKRTQADVWAALEEQREVPYRLLCIGERTYWRFEDRFYWDNDGLDRDQVYALLVTRQRREQSRIERAQAMVAQDFEGSGAQRGAIPDDVKQYVFQRDAGRCRHCGSASELQFDHVIPVTMGGASTEENLQVLCGPCNRRKGAGLTNR